MYDITPIIEAVAALIGVIVTCVLIPFIKSKTTASQQAEINAWVKIAVSAAEQIFKGSGRGEEKKQYVIAWLKERGVTVNENELDALIEGAEARLAGGAGDDEGVAQVVFNEVFDQILIDLVVDLFLLVEGGHQGQENLPVFLGKLFSRHAAFLLNSV